MPQVSEAIEAGQMSADGVRNALASGSPLAQVAGSQHYARTQLARKFTPPAGYASGKHHHGQAETAGYVLKAHILR